MLAATGAGRPGLAELIGPAGGRHWAPTRKWQNRSSPGDRTRRAPLGSDPQVAEPLQPRGVRSTSAFHQL